MADEADAERARRRAQVLQEIDDAKRRDRQAAADAERARRQQNR